MSTLASSYNATTLRHEPDTFEQKYGYTSDEHMFRRYVEGSTPGVTMFDSHVWATTYQEWRQMSSGL